MVKKKDSKLQKWLLWGGFLTLSLVVVVGLIVKPYLNWKTYTIDNLISVSYPPYWHFQKDSNIELSGYEELFMFSDYNGKLSRQDSSSPSQVFTVDADRILKNKVKSLDENVAPFLKFCENEKCTEQVTRYKQNGYSVIKIVIKNNDVNVFYRDQYVLSVEGDKYFYTLNFGFAPGPGTFSDSLRGGLLKKIVDSVVIKPK